MAKNEIGSAYIYKAVKSLVTQHENYLGHHCKRKSSLNEEGDKSPTTNGKA